MKTKNQKLTITKLKIQTIILSLILFSGSVKANVSVQEKISTGYSPWSTSYFGLFNSELKSQEEGGARLSSYNYFSLSYKTSGDRKFSFRVPFTFNSAGFDEFNGNKNNEQEMLLQDLILSFTDYNLILLPWDIGVYWEGRIYLPTSQQSKDTKLITRLRNDFIFSKYLNSHWVMEYASKLNYFYQSQSAYENSFVDENGFDVNLTSRTKNLSHEHWFSLWFRTVPEFSLGILAGWEDTYYNKSKNNLGKDKDNQHEYKLGPQLAFELSSNANFIFQISDNVNNKFNRSELGAFKSENVEMTLLAFVRF